MNTGRNELAANNTDGVYNCENAAAKQSGKNVLVDMDFYEALKTVKDGETIFGDVSDEIAELIDKDYGIH
jgi:hypothetical protein